MKYGGFSYRFFSLKNESILKIPSNSHSSRKTSWGKNSPVIIHFDRLGFSLTKIGFPEIGIAPNHPFLDGMFPHKNQSATLGYPHDELQPPRAPRRPARWSNTKSPARAGPRSAPAGWVEHGRNTSFTRVCVYIYICIYLFIHLFIYLFVYSFIYSFIYLYLCLYMIE